jgi:hypothetical protein
VNLSVRPPLGNSKDEIRQKNLTLISTGKIVARTMRPRIEEGAIKVKSNKGFDFARSFNNFI